MAEKASFFHDHRAVELIMSSTGRSKHKNFDRGVHNFDSDVEDMEKKNRV